MSARRESCGTHIFAGTSEDGVGSLLGGVPAGASRALLQTGLSQTVLSMWERMSGRQGEAERSASVPQDIVTGMEAKEQAEQACLKTLKPLEQKRRTGPSTLHTGELGEPWRLLEITGDNGESSQDQP
ncbi:hypothetical protein NDU88_006028 [Pleurodeles waltl]|uniref:Uncharacterized protein n=1 Tax=Pleurodeles waltl TaxID=8319 RepID=A0AAV7VNG4_PLEWA|nr:hypothetical protein NDU88_006028 [Pleurodeles waltl]